MITFFVPVQGPFKLLKEEVNAISSNIISIYLLSLSSSNTIDFLINTHALSSAYLSAATSNFKYQTEDNFEGSSLSSSTRVEIISSSDIVEHIFPVCVHTILLYCTNTYP